MINRNDTCWCNSSKKWKKCHFPQLPPGNRTEGEEKERKIAEKYLRQWGIIVKTDLHQIEGTRRAGHFAALILDEVVRLIKPGVTTNELDRYAHKRMVDSGAKPAPLGYGNPPFPKSICTSINEVICHGIPNDTPLQEGDIVNIDISLFLNGYCGDCGKMAIVGKSTTEERRRVCDVSYRCLEQSIQQAVAPHNMLSKIGDIIQTISDAAGTSVVEAFVGHGIGMKMHEAPNVFHFRNNLQIPLTPGMIFTIEPMINAGVKEHLIDRNDKWTARTKDGKASAQWEHTVLVTESGYEILTPWSLDGCGMS